MCLRFAYTKRHEDAAILFSQHYHVSIGGPCPFQEEAQWLRILFRKFPIASSHDSMALERAHFRYHASHRLCCSHKKHRDGRLCHRLKFESCRPHPGAQGGHGQSVNRVMLQIAPGLLGLLGLGLAMGGPCLWPGSRPHIRL